MSRRASAAGDAVPSSRLRTSMPWKAREEQIEVIHPAPGLPRAPATAGPCVDRGGRRRAGARPGCHRRSAWARGLARNRPAVGCASPDPGPCLRPARAWRHACHRWPACHRAAARCARAGATAVHRPARRDADRGQSRAAIRRTDPDCRARPVQPAARCPGRMLDAGRVRETMVKDLTKVPLPEIHDQLLEAGLLPKPGRPALDCRTWPGAGHAKPRHKPERAWLWSRPCSLDPSHIRGGRSHVPHEAGHANPVRMRFLTDFADQAVVLPLIAVVALMLASLGWRRGAVASARCAVGACFGAVLALKLVFFTCGPALRLSTLRGPSGHAAAAAMIAGGIAVALGRQKRRGRCHCRPQRPDDRCNAGGTWLAFNRRGRRRCACWACWARSASPGWPDHRRCCGFVGCLVSIAAVAVLLHGQHLNAESRVRAAAFSLPLCADDPVRP